MNVDVNFSGIHTSFCDSNRCSLIVFLNGCNYHCPFCQNQKLKTAINYININNVKNLIAENFSCVSECIYSGGEPLLQIDALIELLRYTKSIGLLSGIETAGYQSHKLEPALKDRLVDFIYLDFKTSPQKYEAVTGSANAFFDMYSLMYLCKKYGVQCEIRTTDVPPDITTPAILSEIGRIANSFGFKHKIQEVR